MYGMDGWTNGWMDEWTDGWMDEGMDGWMDGGMDGWMDEGMDGWVDGRTCLLLTNLCALSKLVGRSWPRVL